VIFWYAPELARLRAQKVTVIFGAKDY